MMPTSRTIPTAPNGEPPTDGACIHELFEAEAARAPEACAVVLGQESITYGELNRRANRIAHLLRARGAGPEKFVGLYLDHSIDMIAALLGVMKAGGAYIPLDVRQPRERLRYILDNAGAVAVITHERMREGAAELGLPILSLDAEADALAGCDTTDPTPLATPLSVAMMLFTSGSTGHPKGVLLPHDGLVRVYRAYESVYELRTRIRSHCQVAHFSFAVFQADVLRALCSGGKLVLAPWEVVCTPSALYETMLREEVHYTEFVPVVIRGLLEHVRANGLSLDFMRAIVLGSDRWYLREHNELKGMVGEETRVLHTFGQTETSIDAAYFTGTSIELPEHGLTPIGSTFPGVHIHIVDDALRPLPDGEPGEMVIGGVGVVRGYHGRPDLTAEKFVPDPFSDRPGARIYRTGDLGRRHPDGTFEFIGRKDSQVKVRGFRIEVGEIEAALDKHPAIRQSVVVAQEIAPGENRLVAYMVPASAPIERDGAAEGRLLTDELMERVPGMRELRTFLEGHVPEYMVPSAIVYMERFPLTSTDKIDRRSLPEPAAEQRDDRDYVAPVGQVEGTVATLLGMVLGVERVGANDNFFELGGHSLLAARAAARLRDAFGAELSVRDIFEFPTVAGLARRVTALLADGDAQRPALVAVDRQRVLPLSMNQQRLWFLEQLDPRSRLYVMTTAVSFDGDVDHAAMQWSLDQVVWRHESLRTSIVTVDGEAVAVIAPAGSAQGRVELQEESVRGAEGVDRAVGRLEMAGFDLSAGPLLRAVLVRDVPMPTAQPGDHKNESAPGHPIIGSVVVLSMHHIISDGWSLGVLQRELRALYAARLAGAESSPLEALPVQYADYAIWQRTWLQGQELRRQLSYWRQQLQGAPAEVTIPYGGVRPRTPSHAGRTEYFAIDSDVAGRLRELAQRGGMTLYMVMLGIYAELLRRYSGSGDVVVGTVVANRTRVETEEVIGFFVNTLALRMSLSGRQSIAEMLEEVRGKVVGGFAHQEVPFDRVVEEVSPERSGSQNPLFQVAFSYQDAGTYGGEGSMGLEEGMVYEGVSKFDVTLTVREGAGGGLMCWLEYSSELYEEEKMHRLVCHYKELARGVSEAAEVEEEREVRMGSLEMLSGAERIEQLAHWQGMETADGPMPTLVDLMAKTVASNAGADALRYAGEVVSYGELWRRSGAVARYLRGRGVGAEVCVGLSMGRSVDLVIGLLGIVRSGGAYVPLDPEYPSERLRHMAEDSRIPLLLVGESDIRPAWLDDDVECMSVAMAEAAGAEMEESMPEMKVAPDQLAYVIYTSGSTGLPKGAMISHRSLANRLLWMRDAYDVGPDDVILQKTPFSFDVSVWELFLPMVAGCPLVLARPGGQRDAAYLVELIAAHGITMLHFVPSMLRLFLEEPSIERIRSIVRRVICSGEALPADLERAFFERFDGELHNLYGPTEATVDVTAWACRRGSTRSVVSIGRPVWNTQCYILDRTMGLVPAGVAGELHLGGIQVGRGYLRRPALTAEKFVPDPFSADPGARLYRTGDLVRYGKDGVIEFLGRIDHQVKLRGNRIELGEIEAVLMEHPAVGDAVVMVREFAPNDERLVAYVVPDAARAADVRAVLAMERAGFPEGASVVELPDGSPFIARNRNETRFLYGEIVEERSYLRHGVEIRDGDIVFDAGANTGMFTRFVASVAPSATIYAFEPIPYLFELLSANARLVGADARLFQCGLAGEAGEARFTYYPNVSLVSGRFADAREEAGVVRAFMRSSAVEDQPPTSPDPADTVPADAAEDDLLLEELLVDRLEALDVTCRLRTLADVIDEHGVERIDLLKVDVEKAELDVLMGLRETDWRKIRQVVVEVHDIDGRLATVTGMLRRHGFDVATEQESVLQESGLYVLYAVAGERGASSLVESSVTSTAGELSEVEVRPASRTPERLVKELRAFVAGKLPEIMRPAAYVMLDAIPLLSSGKADRRALAASFRANHDADTTYVAPRVEIERRIAALLALVLGVERVGVNDNFFELGGHSLLAARAAARLRDAFGAELSVRDIFEFPTVAGLARRVTALLADGDAQRPALVAVDRQRVLPLSMNQQRLWFLEQLDPRSRLYVMTTAVSFAGDVDHAAMQWSLDQVVARQESLRTSIVTVDGEAVAVIAPAGSAQGGVELQEESVRGAEGVDRAVGRLEMAGFDLSAGPLLRAVLVRDVPVPTAQPGGDGSMGGHPVTGSVVVLSMHHIISDGWSLGVLQRELRALYAARMAGAESSPLEALPVQYADYAIWQRTWLQGQELRRQLSYWRQQLQGAPAEVTIPYGGVRPRTPSHAGRTEYFTIDAEVAGRLRELGQRGGMTLYMVMLGIYAELLRRYSGSGDVVVGTVVANRTRVETEEVIGFFVNTLALRLRVSGDQSIAEMLEEVRGRVVGGFAHQEVPFDRVVEEVSPERRGSQNPLFQVAFSYQDAGTYGGEGGMGLGEGMVYEGVSKFDVTLTVREGVGGGLMCWLEYSSELYEGERMHRLVGHYKELARGVSGAAAAEEEREVRMGDLEMLSEAELIEQLAHWQGEPQAYGEEELAAMGLERDDVTVLELMERIVESDGDRDALRYAGEVVSYRELWRRSGAVARYLRGRGVGAEVCVGLSMGRSVDLVIGLLGIVRSGGAYVPLDPEYPSERLRHMAGDSRIALLLVGEDDESGSPEIHGWLPDGVERVSVRRAEEGMRMAGADADMPLDWKVSPDQLAYVIYTSGSTGLPKGAMISHRSLANIPLGQRPVFRPSFDDRILQFASPNFDASVFEFILALTSGAALCMAPSEQLLPGPNLAAFLERERVTRLLVPPSALAVMQRKDLPDTIRTIVVAGEASGAELIARYVGPYTIVNAYGPTETTIWATAAVGLDGRRTPPIGRPVANTRGYILDGSMNPVPVGVPGELHIGGIQVGRGYLRRPGLTAEKFIPDPFSRLPGARMYRTGDLVRYDAAGAIEFLGRIDRQVKLRGFRIELGEIEAVLESHPDVRSAIVDMRALAPNDDRLVAYIVAGSREPSAAELREILAGRLPSHMIPGAFVRLEELPLMPNGKVDRSRLPLPDRWRVHDDGDYTQARTPVEAMITGIWCDLLALEDVGVGDDFFEVGGHSLSAVRLAVKIASVFAIPFAVRQVFEAPTIAAQALLVTDALRIGAPARPPIPRAPRRESIPLSYAQARLWFIDRMTPGGGHYNVATTIPFESDADIALIERSLGQIVERHEILRTGFGEVAGGPVQQIHRPSPAKLDVADLRGLPAHEVETRTRRLLSAVTGAPFDLTDFPLMRSLLVHRSDGDLLLVIAMHHIIADGWSVGILRRELRALYDAFRSGESPQLPELPIQYADYAAWQRSDAGRWEEEEEFWRRTLDGAPSLLPLPTDFPRPERQGYAGARLDFHLDAELHGRLRALARSSGKTMFMLLLAAYGAVLHAEAGCDDVLIGTDVANRGRAELEPLIGFMTNQIVLRLDYSGAPSFSDLLDRVGVTTLAAYAHQELPFERLVEILLPERSLAHAPIVQAKMIVQNTLEDATDAGDPLAHLRGNAPVAIPAPGEAYPATAQLDMTLFFTERSDGLDGALVFSTELFDAERMVSMIARLVALLERACAMPGRSIDELLADDEAPTGMVALDEAGDEWASP